MHMPIPLHALRKTLGQLSPNLEYWVTYMGGYITYKYHISDLKTGHVINFNCACALVTKIWDVVNILLSVNGPIRRAKERKCEAILGHFWFFISNDSIFQGLSNDASISRIWHLVKFSLAILNLAKSRELQTRQKTTGRFVEKSREISPCSSIVIISHRCKGKKG